MANGRQLEVNLAFNADTSKVKSQLQDLQKQLTQVMKVGETMGKHYGMTKEIQEATEAAASLKAHLEQATNVKTGKLDLGLLNKSLKDSGMTLDQYRVNLQKMGTTGEQAFNSLANSILKAEVPLKQTNTLLNNFATTLKNTAKWQISSSILHGFMGSIQSAYYYAEDLNESLNNIRIVTGQSVDQMAQFAKEANEAAKALSTTTTEYTNASLIYYQQGLSDAEVKERTDVTIKMANVARESAETVSQQMTAVWNNFYDGSKSVEYYADVMTALGAATASSTDEIAEGLEKFAAVADTVGLSYEYATSALATITAQTRQSANVVGNALKTIFARMEGLRLGKSLEDGVDLNKYSAALAAIGVSIKDTNGELKTMDQILDETGERWKTLSKEQQVATAQTVAGVRQYTQFAALMNNWDFFQKNLEAVSGAEGALQKQADIYAESWEAAQDRVRASLESIWSEMVNDKFFIDMNNGFAKFLDNLNAVIKGIGGVKGVLLLLGATATKVFSQDMAKGINTFIYNLQNSEKIAAQVRESALNSAVSMAKDSNLGEAYEHIIQVQQAYMENAEKMSEYERRTAEYLMEQHEARAQELIVLGKEQKETQEILRLEERRFKAQVQALNTSKKKNKNANNAQDAVTQYKELRKVTDQVSTSLAKAYSILEKGKSPESLKEINQMFQDINTNSLVFSDTVKNAFATLRTNSADATAVEVAINQLSNAMDSMGTSAGLDSEIMHQLKSAMGELAGSSEQAEQIINKVITAIDNNANAEDKCANATRNLEMQTNGLIEGFNRVQQKAMTTGEFIVALGNALSSVAMSINALKSIGDVWNDETLSAGEKTLSIVTSLGLALPMLISGAKSSMAVISGVPTMLMRIAAALGSTVAAEALAAGGAITLSGAFQALTASAMAFIATPVGAAIAAIVAVVGVVAVGIYSMAQALEADAKAAEKASKTAEELTKQYNDIRTAYDEAKKSISDYHSAVDALSKLTTNTQEWKEAVFELNEQVIDLIDKYPSLAEFVDTSANGVMSISKTGLDQLQQEQETRVRNAARASNLSKVNAGIAQGQNQISQYVQKSDLFGYTGDRRNQQEVEKVVQALNTHGIQLLQNSQLLSKVTGIEEDEVQYLLQDAKGLKELAVQLKANTEANKVYAKEVGKSILEDKGMNDTEFAQQLEMFLGAKSQELYLSKSKEWEHKDAQQEYADLDSSTEWVRDLGDGKGLYRVNGELQEISDTIVRETVAQAEATKAAADEIEKYTAALSDVKSLSSDMSDNLFNYITKVDQSIDNLTDKDVKALQDLKFEDLEDSTRETLGLGSAESLEELKTSTNDAWDQALESIKNNMFLTTRKVFSELSDAGSFEGLSLKVREKVANALDNAFVDGGEYKFQTLANALKQLKPDEMEAYVTTMENIDWNHISVDNLSKALQEAGVQTRFTTNELEAMIAGLKETKYTVEGATEAYAGLHSVIDKLTDGGTVTAKEMEQLGNNYQDYFLKMADGSYKLITDAQTFYDLVNKDSVAGFEHVVDQIKSIEKSGFDVDQLSSSALTGISNVKQFNGDKVNTQLDFLSVTGGASNEQIAGWADLINNGKQTKQTFDEIAQAVENNKQLWGEFTNIQAEAQEKIASTATNLNELHGMLDDDTISAEAFTKAALAMDAANDTKNLKSDELKQYSDYLQEAAENWDGFNKSMSKDESRVVAKGIMKMNQALDTLADNFVKTEDNVNSWEDILRNSSDTSEEYAEAMTKTKEAVADLLDISPEAVSQQFIKDNLDEIKEAASGSEKAIDSLKASLSEQLILDIIIKNDLENSKDSILSSFRDLQNSIPDIEVGATLDDGEFLTKAQKLIEDCGMTVDQANAMFDSLGFEANFVKEPQVIHQRVPRYITETSVQSIGFTEDGKPMVTTATSTHQDGFDEFDGEMDVPAMSTNGKTPVINSLVKKASGSANNYSSKNKGGQSTPGKSGAKKGKGGGKEKDPDKKDKVKDEVDRYYDINNAIAVVNDTLTKNEQIQKKIGTLQSHYFGKALAKYLKEENNLLKQRNTILESQYANYEKLYKLQKQELADLKSKIGGLWEGDVLQNYSQLFQANMDKYNAVIEKYNAMTKKQQEKTGKDMLEQAKKVYEEYKKNLERYQKLYYNEMLDTENKLAEMRQQQLENQLKMIENNLKAYEAKIQIKLDKTKLQREWNEFIKEAQDDFRKVFSDLSLDSKLRKDNFGEYEKDVDERIKQIQDVENEIDKMEKAKNKKGEVVLDDDFMFGSISEAQEKLKELQSELVEAGKNLREMYKQIWDNYIKGLDQAAQGFEGLNGEFEHITKNLEYEKELIELVYGDKAYDLMDKYYETQQKHILNQVDSTRKQAQFWEQQFNKAYEMNKDKHKIDMNDQSTWTEDMKKAYDEMIKSQDKLNDLVLEGIKNIQGRYLNGIRKTVENAQKQMFNGQTLDQVRRQWDFAKKQSELYLDDTEKIYEITTLTNKINKSIKDYANNSKAQQKLNKLRESELKTLREKEKLTKYDIQLAEQRYQIALKELEIENAKENKNAMKLTRDESGNWTYQYVADEQQTEDKKQELLDLIDQLRQIAEEGETAMKDLWLEAWEDYWERYQEIVEDTTLTEEEKLAKIQELNAEMWPVIEEYGYNAQRYQQEAIAATAVETAKACEMEETNYANLSESQKKMVDAVQDHHLTSYEEIRDAIVGDYDTIAQKGQDDFSDLKKAAEDNYKDTNALSKTTVGQIIKDWDENSKSSFKGAMTDAYKEVQKLTQQYEKEIQELEKVSGKNIMDPGGVVDDLEHIGEQTDEVAGKTDDMVDGATSRLDELREFVNEVEEAWDAVIDKIQDAIDALQDYIDKMSEAQSVGKSSGGSSEPPKSDLPTPAPSDDKKKDDKSGGDKSGGGTPSGPSTPEITTKWSITGGKKDVTRSEKEDRGVFTFFLKNNKGGTADQDYYNGDKNLSVSEAEVYFRKSFRKKYPGLRTGGYTGDWGDDSGRLAVLHKKELVLNANDTKNMLQMVDTVRDLAHLNNSIGQMIAESIGKIVANTINPARVGNVNTSTDNSQTSNVFNVTAEFPNANDAQTIKEAILNLPNIVSQYVHQR